MAATRSSASAYEFDGYRLEPGRRALTRADGTPVKLQAKAFDTIVYLVEHAGELVDRDVLRQALWPRRVVEDNNLNQAIAGVRRALGEQHVVTVAGRGYQWVTPVHPVVPKPTSDGGSDLPTSPAATIAERWRRGSMRPFATALVVAATAVMVAAAGYALLLDPWRTESPPRLGPIKLITPITTYPGEESSPSFSPDGTKIVFSWDRGTGKADLYVTQIGTSTPHQLTSSTEGNDNYPAWSPDGERIAFLRQYDQARFDVVVIPALGGPEQKLYYGEKRWVSVAGFPLLAWTPEGRQLVFTARRSGDAAESYGLVSLTLATGKIMTWPVDDPRNYDTSPAISPSGAWLAFVRYHRPARLNQLMVQPLGADFMPTASPRPVLGLDAGLYHSLSWDPASQRLWFANGGQILEWPIGGKARVVATLGSRLSAAGVAMSVHGKVTRGAMVEAHSNGDLFALPLDPTTHKSTGPPAVRAPSSSIEQHPRFSPNGRQIAFVSDRSGNREIWVADANGDAPRQVTSVGQLITGYPRWSPDGTHIVFHASGSSESRFIYVVDVASGSTRRLSSGCCPGGWSADGRYVYITDGSGVGAPNVVRMNVETGSVETLFPGEVAVESADGRSLLYAKTAMRGYFRRALQGVPADNPEERLVDDYTPALGGIAPMADGFYYLSSTPTGRPRALRFYDYAHGRAEDVADAPDTLLTGLSVSPAGDELLYSAVAGRPEADIMLLDFGAEAAE